MKSTSEDLKAIKNGLNGRQKRMRNQNSLDTTLALLKAMKIKVKLENWNKCAEKKKPFEHS